MLNKGLVSVPVSPLFSTCSNRRCFQVIADDETSSRSDKYLYPRSSSDSSLPWLTRDNGYQSTCARLFLTHGPNLDVARNLKRALELVNIVAHNLYEDFVNPDGRRLGEYLGAVREAISKKSDLR